MDKIRAKIKVLLAETVFYEFAKRIYNWIKIKRDAHAFKLKYPNSYYVNYSPTELSLQRTNGFTSQYGQDYFLWYEMLDQKKAGVFVDIGANHPVENNNSYYLGKAGWTGIAIDPLKQFQKPWQQKRTTKLICGAVAIQENDVAFLEIKPKQGWEYALSGFKEHIRAEDLTIYDYEEYIIRTKPLHCFVSDLPKLDLALIDVEGAEMQVLEGINFDFFTPSHILIENDSQIGGCDSIRRFLEDRSYQCVARISATDDLFVRKTLSN